MMTHNEQPTLKDIEEHLNRQDREVKKSTYGSYAAFGASIIMVGVSLWIGSRILSADTLIWDFVFLIAVGFIVMSWSWYKQRNSKDSIDTHYCRGIESDKIVTMTEQELPSIDVVLDEVRRKLDFQFEQIDGVSTKSGIVLGVAGVIFTLLVTNLLSQSSTISNLFLAKIALIPIFVSLVLSFVPIYIIKWDRPPNLNRLRDYYIVKNIENTKLNVVDKCLEAVDNNQKLISKLFCLIKCSYILLLIGLALLAIWIGMIIW